MEEHPFVGRVDIAPLLPLREEALVERVELLHLRGRDLELEDVDVLGDALGPHRLRQRHVTVLHGPADVNLGRRRTVGLGDLLDHGVVEALGAGQRRVRDQSNAARLAEGLDLVLA